VGFTKKKAQH